MLIRALRMRHKYMRMSMQAFPEHVHKFLDVASERTRLNSELGLPPHSVSAASFGQLAAAATASIDAAHLAPPTLSDQHQHSSANLGESTGHLHHAKSSKLFFDANPGIKAVDAQPSNVKLILRTYRSSMTPPAARFAW